MRVNNTRPSVQTAGVGERFVLNDLQDKTEIYGDAEDERKNGEQRGPDGGWGWAVVIGTALVMALVPTMLLCLGLVLVELRETYAYVSYAQLAVIPALLLAGWNFVGALSSVLVGIVSCRALTCIAGSLLAVGVGVTFYAQNIEFFYITFATLGGVGAGLSLSPGSVLLSRYFTKRKDFATSVCLVVGSVGQVFVPHLLVFLVDVYSIQGALLVMGALFLHVCVSAALFRPFGEPANSQKSLSRSSHRRINLYTRDPATGRTHVTKVIVVKKGVQGKVKKKLPLPPDDLDLDSSDRQWRNPCNLVDSAGNSGRFYRVRTYSNSSRFLPDIPEEKEPSTDDDHGEEPTEESELQDGRPRSESCVRFRLDSDASDYNGSSTNVLSSVPASLRMRERTDSNCSSSTVTSAISYLGSCNSVCSDHLQIETERTKYMPSRPLCLRVIDSKLMTNPIFWVLATSATLHNVAFPNVLIYIPFRAYALGLTPEQTACVLSFYALGDVFGRLLVPLLTQRLSPQLVFIFMGTIAIAGITGLTFSSTFLSLGSSSTVFGFSSGACTVVMTPLLFTYLGKVQFSFALVVSQWLQAICFIIITPIIGVLIDETSMLYAFYVLIGLQTLSVVTWIAEPIAMKCQNHHKQNEAINNSELNNS